MSLTSLISEYGYWAILVGTFLEGETILVLGGLAAHSGYLDLTTVIAVAFVGSLSGDQLYFYIGRAKGMDFIEKRPRWHKPTQKVFDLLHRHQVPLILGFRFLYGLRSVTPFAIGASGISPVRFLILNAIGALIWAITIGTLGYLFGQVVESVMGEIKKYEMWLLGGIAILAVLAWLARYVWTGKQAKKEAVVDEVDADTDAAQAPNSTQQNSVK
ncbi:MAG: DedA family protein [Thiotrichales bacterium]|nr:DedA family protein [Thiotrichales bacterium]